MAIEIVAGRILAPYLGVSLYTWTSIIGVVLAGISSGAWLGGMIGDRYPRFATLWWILIASGIGAFSVSPLTIWAANTPMCNNLMGRTLLIATTIFFVPSCLLGMVSPVAVRLTLTTVEKVGAVAGKMYAFSTVGSILGTFATGFFLISWLGTKDLLFATGILLLLCALFFTEWSRRKAICVLVLCTFLWPLHHYAFKQDLDSETFFFKESNYYTIRAKRNYGHDSDRLITLYLDQLTHSCSDPTDPFRLQFRYIRSYREIVEWWAAGKTGLSTFFIGGGGYTFPRFIESKYPDATIDVVEIDPMVTEVAYKHFGVSSTSRIRTFSEDSRWFVMNHEGEGVYDIIFEDAFNDLSIPYHLTTREFAVQLKRLLKKDGLLLTNTIDRFGEGSFLPAYIRTLEEVFGRGNVHLVVFGSPNGDTGVDNRVVIAGPRGLSISGLNRHLSELESGNRISHLLPPEELQNRLDKFSPVVLTDDYVPVDNLTAANFR